MAKLYVDIYLRAGHAAETLNRFLARSNVLKRATLHHGD